MSTIAVVGAKHSPGASTLALALAAASGDDLALVIEADPAGGDLAVRAGLALDPGLVSLAAAGRHGLTPLQLHAHSQRLASGPHVVVAPPSADLTRTSLDGLTRFLPVVLSVWPGLAIVDAGRGGSSANRMPLASACETVLVVFRPTAEGVEHARNRVASLGGSRVVAVAVGDRPYGRQEIERCLPGVEVRTVDYDERAARLLCSGAPLDRWLRRSALLRSASALLSEMAAASSVAS